MARKLHLTKEITTPEPGPERISAEEGSALREAHLRRQVAAQRVELLVSEHKHAVRDAQQADQQCRELEAALVAAYKLGPQDKVDTATRAITRAAAEPAKETP